MEDENASTTETAAAAASTDQPGTLPAEVKPSGKTFSQEDLDRIVAERLSQERRARAKEAPRPPAAASAPVTANEKPVSAMSATEIRQMMARDREFTRVTATAGLSDRQALRMEAALIAENPESVTEWSTAYLADMGLAKSPAAPAAPSPATNPHSTTPAEPPRAPVAAPSAPTGHGLPMQDGITDIFSLTPQQMKDLGPAGVRKSLEDLQRVGGAQSGIPTRPKPPSQR